MSDPGKQNAPVKSSLNQVAGAHVLVEGKPGIFLGLCILDHDELACVIRTEEYGLFLRMFHPSKVRWPEK